VNERRGRADQYETSPHSEDTISVIPETDSGLSAFLDAFSCSVINPLSSCLFETSFRVWSLLLVLLRIYFHFTFHRTYKTMNQESCFYQTALLAFCPSQKNDCEAWNGFAWLY
jgi:hypothetical protein